VLFSDIPKKNNASETSAASPDGSVKDKSRTADKVTLKKTQEMQLNGMGASIESYD